MFMPTGKYTIANLPFRQLYFLPTGGYQLIFRQLANFTREIRQFGEYRADIGNLNQLSCNSSVALNIIIVVDLGNFERGYGA